MGAKDFHHSRRETTALDETGRGEGRNGNEMAERDGSHQTGKSK